MEDSTFCAKVLIKFLELLKINKKPILGVPKKDQLSVT